MEADPLQSYRSMDCHTSFKVHFLDSLRLLPRSKTNQGTTAELFYEWVPGKRKSSVGGENKTSAIARIRGNAIERVIPCQCVHPAVTLHIRKHLGHRRLKLPTSVVVRARLNITRGNTKYVDIFLCTHTHTKPLDTAWLHNAVGNISVWNKPLNRQYGEVPKCRNIKMISHQADKCHTKSITCSR
jgi:hypothetical protein